MINHMNTVGPRGGVHNAILSSTVFTTACNLMEHILY